MSKREALDGTSLFTLANTFRLCGLADEFGRPWIADFEVDLDTDLVGDASESPRCCTRPILRGFGFGVASGSG
jgi:hypothetical protein